MAEKLFTNAFEFNSNGNKVEILEENILSLKISTARITNACLMAVVKECNAESSTLVKVKYNNQEPQVIDIIAPKKGDKISINITEELNCLIKFAFRYSGNLKRDNKISVLFDSNIVLEKVDLYAEYIPEQIMHENSAYFDYDVRQAGNGKINLATGTLRFTHQCGNEVSLVYNDTQTKKRSTTVYDVQGEKTKFRHGVGKGFKLNLEQFLLKREGTDKQSVYTYVDGEGNYHEFSEKYYYFADGKEGEKQKVFIPKSKVQVDLNGHLKYVINEFDQKKVFIERKTTNGLYLEQDYSNFKGAEYLENRQQEQIELEENTNALEGQLKKYVIVNKTTGKTLESGGTLKDMFQKNGPLSVAAYESFLNALKDNRLLFTETEAIQYQSLLLQQTVESDIVTADLAVKSSYTNGKYYSDEKNRDKGRNVYEHGKYKKTLISLRKLVSDLHKDFATLTRKFEVCYTDPNFNRTYLCQYDVYLDYLKQHDYAKGNCCIDIARIDNKKKNLNEYVDQGEGVDNLTINIGHIENRYCDLKLELERINDHIDSYNRGESAKKVRPMLVRQKVVEQRYRLFQQDFTYRTDRLQANIAKFEADVNDFTEKLQGELINEQIYMMLETSEKNKVDLEKYFKQYYNNKHELMQMKWQMPTYFITGNEGVTKGFNKDGYLVALFDNYENQTAIIYTKGRISSVTDKDNKTLSFEYDNNKRINKIITSDGKAYNLFYGGEEKKKELEGLLTKIVDSNGEETLLGYDYYGFLNSVKDSNSFGVKFVYDKYGRVVKVNQTSQIKLVTDKETTFAGSEVSKTLASINYLDSHLTTSVTDEVGLVKTYNFDIVGKVITMYEGQYSDPEETTRAKSFEYTDNKKSFSISDNIAAENLIAGTVKAILMERAKKVSPEGTRIKTHTSRITANKFELAGTRDNQPCEATQAIELDVSLFKENVSDYVFSVWAIADSAYIESDRSQKYTNKNINKIYGITTDDKKINRKFEVRAKITYEDKTSATFVAGFDWLNTKWQYLAMPIEVKQGKKVTSCIITLDYSNNVGNATFDCLSLREGSWTYNEFDEEGKQTYSEDSASRTSTKYFYDNKSRVIKEELTDAQGNIFTSTKEYNAQGSLVRSINYAGVVEETVYDDKGRELKKIKYNIDDPTSKFYEESKRDDNGNVTADIDESGEYDSVTYTYDNNGETAVQADGKGNKTAFGYKDGNLVSISGSSDGEESINTMHHTASLLTKVSNGETIFNYEYDGWGRNTSVKIAGEKFEISKGYKDNLHSTIEYADKYSYSTESDVYGNIVKQTVKLNDKIIEEVTNTYDANTGKLTVTVVDNGSENGYTVKYGYDFKGNTKTEIRDGLFALSKEFKYTPSNDLESTTYTVDGNELKYKYEKDNTPDKRDSKVTLPFDIEQNFAYDGLGRTREVALGKNLVKNIYYQKFGDHTTNRVSTIWYGINGIRKDSLKYTYDKAGNIETVTENGKLVARYFYDGLNRLVREDNINFGTFTFQYDVAGNILSKTEYAFTLKETLSEIKTVNEYSYKQHGWKDQLLSINGVACEYDVMGNPTVYRGRTLKWDRRRLLGYANVDKQATYTYDANGVRTSKSATGIDTANGKKKTESKYIYDGNNLIAELRDKMWIYYLYGVDGIAGFRYNGTTYLYRKNAQGDITHIYTADGQLVAQYVYDALGNTKILPEDEAEDLSSIANFNPFRYRGYYYDTETGLYYLISRYYDPETGRFISSDSIEYLDPETLGGLNLYAYCGNNPVMYVDPKGEFLLSFLAALLVAAVVGAATSALGTLIGDLFVSAISGEWQISSWETYVGSMIGGAVGGVISLFLPFAGVVIGGTLGTFAGLAIGKATGSNDMSWGEIGVLTAVSLGVNLMTAGLTQCIKIPGITKGSHSWQQVFKSGFTKAIRYGFSMSAKTIAKEAGYLLVSSVSLGFLFSNIINAVIGNGYTKLKDFYYKNLKHTFPDVTSPNTYFA